MVEVGYGDPRCINRRRGDRAHPDFIVWYHSIDTTAPLFMVYGASLCRRTHPGRRDASPWKVSLSRRLALAVLSGPFLPSSPRRPLIYEIYELTTKHI
uniref:U1740m n=1 Tax=Mycobacterium leprae TaxID=1769 RepID=Q50069_MYCLR|nr:u1740m [Mycobacterium leprae]